MKKGFTMIEVVVTMLIVIALSLISYPIYTGRHRETVALSEGYALLGVIKDAQIGYYNEWGYFYGRSSCTGQDCWTAVEPGLGINALNNKYFTWFNAMNGVDGGRYNHQGADYGYRRFFKAVVRSAKAGTITLIFNVTEKATDPIVSGTTGIKVW